MKFVAIFLTSLSLCAEEPTKFEIGWEPHQILAILEVADLTHGVDATEARALAEAYFRQTEGFDGGLWSIQRDGEWWRFETVVGQGTEGDDIRIHAKNGQILKDGEKTLLFPWKGLRKWYADLAALTHKAQQGVAPQSATRSESKSEGGDKLQPESKVRSQ